MMIFFVALKKKLIKKFGDSKSSVLILYPYLVPWYIIFLICFCWFYPSISSFVFIILNFISHFIGTNNILKVARNVHEGSVFSICVLKEGSIITGGGKDGKLIQFDTSMHPTGYEAQVSYYYYYYINIFSIKLFAI